ncbi:MAG: T9SS type A sorting domain-containing protein, partial [Bacteroidales bacterium]|nr:T9SS type A sorting domain-containing protein [Bacteroidales bacterium]
AGTTTLNATSITKNEATTNGGAIYLNDGTLTFASNASTIGGAWTDRNTAVDGAGLYMAGGKCTTSVAQTISYNTASGNGGGVYFGGGTPTLTSALTLSYNKAANGGGLYTNASFTAGSAKLVLTGDTATTSGGGLYVKTGTTSLNKISITKNKATNNGGGIYVSSGTLKFVTGQSTIGGSWANRNTAKNGGGLYAYGGTITVSKAPKISHNTATTNGGGVYTRRTISFASGTIISNNKAASGGGIYIYANTTTLNNATFENDTATGNGGAIYLNGGGLTFNTTASMIGSSGNANRAANGAGMYIAGGTVTFTVAPSIAYNAASTAGGGIYTNIAALDLRNTYIVNNTAGTKGGGVYVNDSQNAGDYAATKIVKVGGNMKIIGNTVSSNENNVYVMSRNNIHFVETFADTSSVGVYCVRSATAYPAYGANNTTVYGMREDDLFAKVDFSENDPINNAGRFFNDLTSVTGEFTSTGHTEAGGYPVNPAPVMANNRKAGSGDDLGAVKWQDYSLPIELLSFVGSCQNGVTTFNWETMTETNNDYFTIEASRDAVNYEPVATISGAGTTSQRQQYSYHINTNDGMMYYRLRQTDIDGQTEVFAPIAVKCENAVSSEPTINIYPQPAKDMFEINVQGEGVEIEQMSLYNMLGSCIKRQVVNSQRAAMCLETLSSGVYNLLIRLSDGKLYNKKVVVTK